MNTESTMCSRPSEGEQLPDRLALVLRGGCKFSLKAENAALGGFRGVVILDNQNTTNVNKIPGLRSALTDDIPVIIGSGINPENVGDFAAADAFIVGSFFKEKGDWRNEMCPQRLDQMCQAMQQLCDS